MGFHFNCFGSASPRFFARAACLMGLVVVPAIAGAQGNFGPVNVGSSAPGAVSVTVTLQSSGTIGSILDLTKGAPNLDFTNAAGGTCTVGTTYGEGQTCTALVAFNPQYPGPRYGAVELLTGSGLVLGTAYVQGVGVGPQAVFANSSRVGVYQASAPTTLAICCDYPSGLAVDGSGNVFVASAYTNSVDEIYAAGGYKSYSILGIGALPISVAVDGAGNVFLIGDTGGFTAGTVYEIVAAGGYSTVLTLQATSAAGIAVDGSGNLFLAGGDGVSEVLAADGYTTMNAVASGFSSLSAIAIDGSGNLFVADEGAKTVDEIVAVDGSIPASPMIKTIASGFNLPDGVAVDASGNVFVADFKNDVVDEFLAAGGYKKSITLYRWSPAPYAVAVDQRGNVFTGTADNSIHELDYADPPSFDFANTQVGVLSSDSPQTVMVFNDGNAPLAFTVPSSGVNPSLSANFLLDGTSTCEPTNSGSSTALTLTQGGSCTLAIDSKPEVEGATTGGTVLTDNSLNVAGTTQTIPLTGNGPVLAQALLSATSLSFRSVAVGAASASQWVTLTNNGSAALTITSIAVAGASPSSYVFANTCGASLAVGASCLIHGHFAPTTPGVFSAAVVVNDSASTSPQTIALSGTYAPLQIVPAVFPLATIGVPFSYSFAAGGGVPPYSWSFSGAGPDPGLQLAPTGTLNGSPTLASACPLEASSSWYGADTPILFNVEVTDAANQTAIQQFCMGTYYAAPVIGSVTPSIVTADGAAHTITIAGSNFTPTSEVFVGSGLQVATQFVDTGHLTFTLLPTPNGLFAINQPSSSQVTFEDSTIPTWVVQPVAGPGNLNQSFTIADPVPAITTVSAVLDNTSTPCAPGLYCQLVINGTGLVFDTQIEILNPRITLGRFAWPSTNPPWNSFTTTAFKLGASGPYTVLIANPNQAAGGSISVQGQFPLTPFVPSPLVSGPIFDPGDSLVAGGQDGDYLDTTPSFLQALSGELVYNLGLPRTTSTQIAIGIGAESTNAVGTVTIPACTVASACSGLAVSFPFPQNPNVQQTALGNYNQYQSNLPGTLGGVSGILTCAAGCRLGSGYVFTPNAITSGGTFTAPTWQTDLSVAGIDSGTCVMEGGGNNFGSTATVEADIAAMMAMPCAKLGALQGLAYANTPDQWIGGGDDHNAISTLNAWEAATYPAQAVNIDAMFATVVCPLAETQADPESVIDCGHGVTPALFRAHDMAGTITANINSSTCTIPVSGLTGQGASGFGGGTTILIGTEKIYVTGASGGGVTSCIRGYASTTAASYSAGQAFIGTDAVHLNGPGYQYLAEWDLAVIQAQQP